MSENTMNIPWTVRAWEVVMGGNGQWLPHYLRHALANHPAPEGATFYRDGQGWSLIGGIKNPSAQDRIKWYAKEHGHTIPQEVLDAWEFQAESDRLVELVTDAARKAAQTTVAAMRDESELLRWVSNRLADIAWEKSWEKGAAG